VISLLYLKSSLKIGKIVFNLPIQLLRLINFFIYYFGLIPSLDLSFNIIF